MSSITGAVAQTDDGSAAADRVISAMNADEAIAAAVGIDDSSFSLPVFWSDRFEAGGAGYRDPARLAALADGEAPENACAITGDTLLDDALYCPADESILYDPSFLQQMHESFGPSAVIGVLAHQWGHHLQALTLRPGFSQRAELQADCYAGVYLGHLVDDGLMDISDVLDSLASTESLGDDELGFDNGSEWFDPDLHGTRQQRRQALGVGYSTGDPAYCEAYGLWAPQAPLYLRGPGSEETFPEITLPPASYEAVRADGVRVIPTVGADVLLWLVQLPAGTSAVEALEGLVPVALEPASAELVDVSDGWLDIPLWADGQGARAFLTRTTEDGQTDQGAAAVQIDDDGSTELFIAFGAGDATDPAMAAHRAIDALSWGYCDRWARSQDNCVPIDPDEVPPRPLPLSTPRPLPAGEDAPPLPRATPRPLSRSDARRELRALVPGLTCRGHEGTTVDRTDPLAAGAIAAIRCDRLTREVGPPLKALTLYRFANRDALGDHWRERDESGELPTNTGAESCRDGEVDTDTWEHGVFACDVTPNGRAFFTWTDERHDLYGVLEARDRDVRTLTQAWEQFVS